MFYDAHFFLYYQHGWHVEGVTIIESSSCTRQGDPLGGPIFVLAHYRSFLKTIAWASNYVFPSLTDDIYIVGLMNEFFLHLWPPFNPISQVGLRVKVSKCKFWSPSWIFPSIQFFHSYILVIDGLRILGVLMGFQDFATHFLDEVLS